jgi:predicted protein tyrosine phosphatase
MSFRNRLGNCKNPFQGSYKKVLCLCSAGLLRSPTAAVVLSQEPFNFNTRAAGMSDEYALIPVDDVLLAWADEVVCMEPGWEKELRDKGYKGPIVTLMIPDEYDYRNTDLMKMIKERYEKESEKISKGVKGV